MTIRNTVSLLLALTLGVLIPTAARASNYTEVTYTQGECTSTAIYDDVGYVGCSAIDYDGTYYFMQHEENECVGFCTPALVGNFDDLAEAELLDLLEPACPQGAGAGTSWGRVFWFDAEDLAVAVKLLQKAKIAGFKIVE
jgi:hypothetical protein